MSDAPTPTYRYVDELPAPDELIPNGGRPGCEYAYVDLEHLAEAQAAGWRALNRHEELGGGVFIATLVWEGEERPFTVCERGDRVRGVSPHGFQCPCSVSEYLTRPARPTAPPLSPSKGSDKLSDIPKVA